LPYQNDLAQVWKYLYKEEMAEHQGPYYGPNHGSNVEDRRVSAKTVWSAVCDVRFFFKKKKRIDQAN